MFKKFSIAILCVVMLLSFCACSKDQAPQNDGTTIQMESSLTNETSQSSQSEESSQPEEEPSQPEESSQPEGEPSQPEEEKNAVFKTEDIVRVTFYAYYGSGKGSDVPSENMTEIINWLGSFTIGEKELDMVPPGTNTYYVEIEYSDGTIIKHGLDTRTIDGDTYYLESDDQPECFMDIISKTSLFE